MRCCFHDRLHLRLAFVLLDRHHSRLARWPAMEPGGLFPVVGAFAILSIAYPVRNYLRHKKGFTVFELSAAYQKPQPQAQPQPQVKVQPQPITFTSTPADTTPAVGTRSL